MVWDDPVFADGKEFHFLSNSDRYSDAVKKAAHFEKFSKEHGIDNPLEIAWVRRHVYFKYNIHVHVSYIALSCICCTP